jgi:hypothetical protein
LGRDGHNTRRLRLQLAFQLVEKTPIGGVSDDLLRGRLDQTGFAQAKRVPPTGDAERMAVVERVMVGDT